MNTKLFYINLKLITLNVLKLDIKQTVFSVNQLYFTQK